MPDVGVDTALLAPDAAGIARAASLLRTGALVAFPTETVYGLGADATNANAVAALFAAKGRPHFNPLIIHVTDADAAWALVAPDDRARRLAASFWPGPLTLVLPRRTDCQVALLAGAGLDTLAVRVPAHPLAQRLLTAAGVPLAAPSANPSGRISPTEASHVLDGLRGRIAAVLDGGACAVGVESTVVDLSAPAATLLRPGGLPTARVASVIGPLADAPAEPDGALRSPGRMLSHYAPAVPVRLAARTVAADEALLAFGPPLPGAGAVFQLSAAGDTTEAAANLFAGLRSLDAAAARAGLSGIAVMPVPAAGLGEAINDRLRRAAAPRDGGTTPD